MLQNLPFYISRLREAYTCGLEPAEVIEEVYRRIDVIADPGIFLHLIERDEVIKEAKKLSIIDFSEMPLWGIPFVIKDNIDVKGLATTASCPEFSYIANKDAFVVSLLLRAGAILVGKTNLDQFATGLVGTRTPYPVPRNALDSSIVPGGSSSGSAISVALGLVSFSLGTDTAGSGRVPAGLNGIVGLKPTLGALSKTGVVPACRTLDTVSIFTQLVEDAETVLNVAAKFDSVDPYSRHFEKSSISLASPHFTVGVPNEETRRFFDDNHQRDSFEMTMRVLSTLGAKIVEIDFTYLYEVANLLYDGPWIAERYSVVEEFEKQHPDSLYPVTSQVINAARDFSAVDAFRGFYRLQDLKRKLNPIINLLDLICVPTIPAFCTLAELENDPHGANSQLGTYTNFVNLMDFCAIAVPVSNRKDGRPGNVTLLGKAGQDAQVIAFARDLQYTCQGAMGATNWQLPDKKIHIASPAKHEIALTVVGAHMSGLPLNHELTRLGARFLYESKTSPEYRLYSIPGGPPFRPCLVRDESGSSIAIEVWAIPTKHFGEFIKGIPQPLGIGTLKLENNEKIKGFICESCAIKDAEDVTIYGGWRNYLHSISKISSTMKEAGYANR